MSYPEIVKYKNANAYYHVTLEGAATRVAELQQYEGKEEHQPPKKIVFTSLQADYRPSLLEDMAKAVHKNS